MIQSQLLRLDPPYQIISAGGLVGIQLATLIVIDDKTDRDGNYAVETHSHPVVSYSPKLLYPPPRNSVARRISLAPEGAVWNKVEVSDIHVLGIAGEQNSPISLDQYISIIPTDPASTPIKRIWNEKSIVKMFNMPAELHKFGFSFLPSSTLMKRDSDRNVIITLTPDVHPNSTPLVRISFGGSRKTSLADFCVQLFDNDRHPSINRCVIDVTYAVQSIYQLFISPNKIIFSFDTDSTNDNVLRDTLQELTSRLNAELLKQK